MMALQARKSTQKLPRHLRDKLGAAVTYYKNHRHQMDYLSYTEHYFPIGSGVTEALVKQRFCLAGMRWKQPGEAGILNGCDLNSSVFKNQSHRKSITIRK
jgi:hypothetical protein